MSLWLKTFRRHDNCGCSVTYEDGEMRQDAWSKRTWQASPEELAERKELEEKLKLVRFSPEEAAAKEREVLDKIAENGIIEEKHETAENDVLEVGTINLDIYKCVTEDIITDEVIITENQITHIKERHPNDYERFGSYFKEIVENPDYIIEANKPNTALILKEIIEKGEKFKTVLRLATSADNPEYKNSIITFMKTDEKDWRRILKNKKILYKSE